MSIEVATIAAGPARNPRG